MTQENISIGKSIDEKAQHAVDVFQAVYEKFDANSTIIYSRGSDSYNISIALLAAAIIAKE
jgi:hypothetical protein